MSVSLLAALALAAAPLPSPAKAADRDGVAFFEAKIRPVLIKHCYQCHSAEAEKSKKLRGGLLLDSRRGWREGGDSGPAIVPGKSKDSLLIRSLKHESTKMPPKGKLDDAVIADFVKWVDMGAPDPRDGTVLQGKRTIDIDEGKRYWAFRPLAISKPPVVKNSGWARNDIDRFILAGLEAKGLTPSKPLSKEKLIRRVTFDLIGLPPTPEEVDAFVKDTSPNAYEKLVDRLLKSERHGERWARHWLDVARFAESGGYEFDGDRAGAFHYRDFVIKALNADMPFDEFVRLQLAGDEIRPNDFHATSATGFLVAGPYPGQTTAKTLEPIRYDHLDDMIATTGTALLGLGLGCARCHEHKYDPIPQQDYYRLTATLARTDSLVRRMDPNPEIYRAAKAAFDKVHAPLLAARQKYEKEELPGRFDKWLAAEKGKPSTPWLTLESTSATGRVPLKKLADGSLLAGGKAESTDTYTITARTSQKSITAIRIEALSDPSLPKAGPGRAPDGNFCLTEITLSAVPANATATKGARTTPVIKLRADKATFEQAGNALAGAVDTNNKTGWSVGGATGKDHAAVFVAEKPFGFEGGTVLTLTLKFERDFAAGRIRLGLTTAKDAKAEDKTEPQPRREILSLLAEQNGKFDGKHRPQITDWFRRVDTRTEEIFAPVDRSLLNEPKMPQDPVFSATSGRGGDVHYLIRGETDKKNGVAKPGFLQVLTNGSDEARWLRSSSSAKEALPPRVALGAWMTDAKHGAGHLLARVIVNRLWLHHFGQGIVRTPNDFGVQGEPPTHPELLDYLASELIKGGWKLRPIHKLMVTSAAYFQGGEPTDAGLKTDPANRLWWRVPARRIEAEAIRDSVLAVGDSLDLKMYGVGTLDENSTRRSVYLTVKRTRLIPMLQAFDAPEGIQSVGQRQLTTTTPQALTMMNSRLVRAQAEKLARRVLPANMDAVPAAVEKTYQIALGRWPDDSEKKRMSDFIRRLADESKGPRSLELATADFCQVLLCCNEFIYVD